MKQWIAELAQPYLGEPLERMSWSTSRKQEKLCSTDDGRVDVPPNGPEITVGIKTIPCYQS